MEKILPQKSYYGAIFAAYFDYIKLILTQNVCEKKFFYCVKGVGQKSFSTYILGDFDCLCGKISEKIYCNVKYEERPKKLTVTFKAESPKSFLNSLEALKNASLCLLSSYLYELAWGLAEAVFDVEKVKFDSFDNLIVPVVRKDFKHVNPYSVLKNSVQCGCLADDVFCILYNIFLKRKNKFSYVKVNADDILFLKGSNKNSLHYKKEDRKRIYKAITTLCAFNLIRAKKIKRYEWKIFIVQDLFSDGYFLPREIFSLNPRTKYFEKYLAHYIAAQIQQSKKIIELKKPINFLYSNIKYLKPSCARERVENAFDVMVKIGLIKNWQYKKINENELCGTDWILKYKKLKIVFDLKSCGQNSMIHPQFKA